MKKYLWFFLAIILTYIALAVAQPVRQLFEYEKRCPDEVGNNKSNRGLMPGEWASERGDTRPKINLTPGPLPSREGEKGDGSKAPGLSADLSAVVATKVEASAKAGWQPNGICVCDTSWAALPKIVSDGNTGAIICWTESYRGWPGDTVNTVHNIYAQRVDSGGNFLWASQGVPVCSLSTSYASYPAMIPDGCGGAIIAWEDTRDDLGYTRVFAQRLDSFGSRLWAENGVLVCNQMSGYVELCSDGHGGAIIVYSDGRNQAVTSDDIYAQRIDSAGNAVWQIDGVPVCIADSIQFNPSIDVTNTHGAIITWGIDQRNGDRDVYSQLLDSLGNQIWVMNGKPIVVKPGIQVAFNPSNNTIGGGILGYRDFSIDSSCIQSYDSLGNTKWYSTGVMIDISGNLISDKRNGVIVVSASNANRIDSSGIIRWGNGVPLHTGYTGYTNTVVSDNYGGLFDAWDDRRIDPNWSDQYLQKIDSGGNIVWSSTGVAVCTLQMEYESYPKVTQDNAGGAYVAWFGTPNHIITNNRVYAQRVYADGTPGGVAGKPGQNLKFPVSSLLVYPNPINNKAKIAYTLSREANVVIKIYNIMGQRVRHLKSERVPPGIHSVLWDAKDDYGGTVSGGIYFVSLCHDGSRMSKKVIIIR